MEAASGASRADSTCAQESKGTAGAEESKDEAPSVAPSATLAIIALRGGQIRGGSRALSAATMSSVR